MTEENSIHTLYVNNLNEKIPISQMKKTLSLLFSQHGQVQDVQLKKNIKMRGQAFIIFDKKEDAKEAKEQLQNTQLFKKPLRIAFARNENDIVNMKDPNFQKPERKKYILKDYWNSDLFKKNLLSKLERNNFQEEENGKEKLQIKQKNKDETNHILFIKNVPKSIEREQLYNMVIDYPGFVELRYIKPRQCAFVEFEEETQAALALKSLKLKKFQNEETIDVNFSKKG